MLRLQHCNPGAAYFEQTQDVSTEANFSHPAAAEWESFRFGPWLALHPRNDTVLPRQGWKIHISTRPEHASQVLRIVGDVCMDRGVAFKHLASKAELRRASMKYANRGSAGKFITVFPRHDAEFCDLLLAFEEALLGFDGPYILSDVKFGNGPVYFRYGGFFLNRIDREDGTTGFAIQDPEGEPVEDTRSAVFTLPNFVEPPTLVRSLVEERLDPDPTELEQLLHPYIVRSSLHFSNAGGVYLGEVPETGRQVVLKEARRWSAYSSDSTDATQRLQNERRVLESLSPVDAVVNILEYRVIGEHEFLIEEYIPGLTLQSWAASNYPFSTDPTVLIRYCAMAVPLANQIITAVEQIHDAGWSVMDLQPKNILIDGDRIRFIDLEAARELGESAVGSIGTPGFIPHARTTNIGRDRYALAAVILHLFWPSVAGAFDPAVILHRRNKVADLFPDEVTRMVNSLVAAVPSEALVTSHGYRHIPAHGFDRDSALVDQLRDGIEKSRRVGAGTTRRFPGDATQFADGPGAMLNVETGVAGVVLMLSRAGCDVQSDIDWLIHRLRNTDDLPFHGMLRGTVGIAAVLTQLGESDAAELIVRAGTGSEDPGRDLSVRSGLAGSVLALCEFASSGRQTAREDLDRYAALLAMRIDDAGSIRSPQSETGNSVGLFDGWAGVGLACRRLAEVTGDAAWDKRMKTCFDREVKQLAEADSGGLRVDYSRVSYGYLSEGAAGIAFALARCAPSQYRSEIERLAIGFDGIISLNGGLFRGSAGIAAALLPLHTDGAVRERERLLRFTKDSFLFSDADKASLMFLGDNGYHLSADYSTGAAGYLGSLLAHLANDPSLWFPVALPKPLFDEMEGGEYNERIAFSAGPVERVRA